MQNLAGGKDVLFIFPNDKISTLIIIKQSCVQWVFLINKCPFAGMSRMQVLSSSMQAVADVPGKLIRKLPLTFFVWICSGKEVVPPCLF